jgi:hypothetical protein
LDEWLDHLASSNSQAVATEARLGRRNSIAATFDIFLDTILLLGADFEPGGGE